MYNCLARTVVKAPKSSLVTPSDICTGSRLTNTLNINWYYYRAMHFSAKRGIAIACRLSVCPSVRLSDRLSVCDVGEL